jgi:hypothetical protein
MPSRAEYMRGYRSTEVYRAHERAFRAERRKRGLCLQCASVSVKYVRCVECRLKACRNKVRRRLRKSRLPADGCGVSADAPILGTQADTSVETVAS